MRILLFAKRGAKEVLRDPVNLFFGLGFPLILLVLMSVINANIPAEADMRLFEIESLAPGMAMFGATFMALFSGMLLAKDRTASFLTRLFASPMTSVDFILGYTAPMIVMAAAQGVITFAAALAFGLEFSVKIPLAVLVVLPAAVLFVGIGLLTGSLLNDKAVGGICGALLANMAGWLSGIWFPLDLAGGAFKTIAEALPFYHGAEAAKAALSGDFAGILPHLGVVSGYAAVAYTLAVIVFKKRMSGDKT
jgi:ABC-2 type transport system permease protein